MATSQFSCVSRAKRARQPRTAFAVAEDSRHMRAPLDLLVELANRESHASWKDLSVALKRRGLSCVESVVSDDHAGLKAATREVLPEAAWRRAHVRFLRNALDYVPRKAGDDCPREPRFMHDRRDLGPGQTRSCPVARKVAGQIRQASRLGRGQYRLAHHKHMKSTNMLDHPGFADTLVTRIQDDIGEGLPLAGARKRPSALAPLRLCLFPFGREAVESWARSRPVSC